MQIVSIEDLRKELPLEVEYVDYNDDDYHFDGNGTFLSFNDDDRVNNDAAEIMDDNDNYGDGDDNDNNEETEEYESSEDSLKPYGALSYVKEDLKPYGALNYKQQSVNSNFESAELYENSEEELLIIKRTTTTTPRPLKESKAPSYPFRLRLQRLFSNRRVVYLKWIKFEL